MIRRILFLLAVSTACATHAFAQKVTAEFDESVDFKKFKTFAIREGEIKSPSPALNSELTKKRIATELEKALVAKGLQKVTERPDLNVFFNLGAQRGTDTEVYPAGWRGRQRRVVKVPNAQGLMVIDMRDTATRSMVWRAVVNEDEPNPSKLAEKLDDMVKKALKEYPPKK
jgi:hypothetical protein